MLKSIFAKYVLAFMFIILLSFLIIIFIISSIIGNFSAKAKTDIMENTARACAMYIESLLPDSESTEAEALISLSSDETKGILAAISDNTDDLTLLVCDSEGTIILSVGKNTSALIQNAKIPPSLMNELASAGELTQNTRLEGVFSSAEYALALPISNGNSSIFGAVFVCSESVMLASLLEVIINAIVISILWVLLAALIAVYFITEKITGPLKEISVAAKQFADGHFDVRIPVRGNDEIARLAVAMNNMAESLDNYDTMRNTFMSNVSHDLRSPMTSISGFIDGILDGVIPPDKHEYYLKIVSAEIKRLSRLVVSLLDLSRIQAGERKFTPVPFDVCEMCREILISFEQKINDKHLEVEFDCDGGQLTAVADRDAIYQIVYNICDNAVKFSTEGGVLRVSVKRFKSKKLLVSVFNMGQGISEEDLPYVFERFYKSDKSRGLNKNGAGLGLFISKTIIDAHGENIWVESEYEKNCCFSFTLPLE